MEQCASIENRYWDIKDLSEYLKVKIKTLYAMLPDIPHYRLGKLIRFRKQEIDSWMERKRNMAPGQRNGSVNLKGRPSRRCDVDIDGMVRKAIDQSKPEVYNPDHGKSDRIEGPKRR
jgi:excisionase family DNA binding protein